jgi:hypothetical protein
MIWEVDMYLSKAKEILGKEIELNKGLVKEARGKELIEEKSRHSYQVLGAGNMILKNEEIYKKENHLEIDLMKATVLLHDLGRFYEAVCFNVDHGVYGAGLLKDDVDFGVAKVNLAIKHHGHLIEELYEDEEYLKLDENEKNEVKKYIFLVRDADKLANFYLLAREFKDMEDLFFAPKNRTKDKTPTKKVLECFMGHTSVDKRDVKSLSDQALMIMACVYDINYKASFEFLKKMGILEKLMNLFAKFWNEEDVERYKKELFDFVGERIKKAS